MDTNLPSFIILHIYVGTFTSKKFDNTRLSIDYTLQKQQPINEGNGTRDRQRSVALRPFWSTHYLSSRDIAIEQQNRMDG